MVYRLFVAIVAAIQLNFGMPSIIQRRKRALAVTDETQGARSVAARQMLATKGLSRTALSRLMRTIGSEPGLAEASILSIDAAAGAIYETIQQTEMVDMEDGSRPFAWKLCNSNLLVARTLQECPQLARMYVARLQAHPCDVNNPWSLIVTYDEMTPGSIAHPQLYRKTLLIAFNFLELGPWCLSTSESWFVPVAVRTKKVHAAVGGFSHCLARFLRTLLLGDLGVQTAGIAFRVDGKLYKIYARLTNLLADGEGLKYGFDIMGHGGIRPCTRCQNVLRKGSGLAHRRPDFVEITCADHSKLVISTPDDLDREVAAVLDAHAQCAAGTISPNRLKAIESAYGMHANPHGLLADAGLREYFSVMAVFTEDWMHGSLQDGHLSVACKCLLQSVRAKVPSFDKTFLVTFLKADWLWPSSLARKCGSLWRVAENLTENMNVKASASELLGFYVLLKHFVDTIVVPTVDSHGVDLTAELDAFRAACKVVDLIMLIKRGHAFASGNLEALVAEQQTATDQMIQLHIAAYGIDGIKPKHHRMQHIGPQILRDGMVLDCFIIERLHLVARDILGNVRNPIDAEASILKMFCVKHMNAMRETSLCGLIGPSVPLQDFPNAQVAKRIKFCGMDISVGDVVLRSDVAAIVSGCALDSGNAFLIVDPWQVISGYVGRARKWRRSLGGDPEVWPVIEVEVALAWYAEGDDVVVLS